MELAHNEEASLFLSCLLLEMLQKMNDHSHLSHILTSENSAYKIKSYCIKKQGLLSMPHLKTCVKIQKLKSFPKGII